MPGKRLLHDLALFRHPVQEGLEARGTLLFHGGPLVRRREAGRQEAAGLQEAEERDAGRE